MEMNESANRYTIPEPATDATHEYHRGRQANESMRQLLWWLIGGTQGGKNRLRIVRSLNRRPMNTNQLSNELDLNYKTVQHHLEMLEENDVLTTTGDEYGKMYFLTDRMESNLDLLDEIAEQASIDDD